jgi:large subunit ribosomal protein L31e
MVSELVPGIGRKTEDKSIQRLTMGSKVHGVSFKKRAPRAIKEIRDFATKAMVWIRVMRFFHPTMSSDADDSTPQGTGDVRLDPQLNKKVWESGIKGVPFRLRVRISRKRNDEEGAKEKLYSYVQAVNVKNPKGLQTTVVEDTQ